MAQLLQIQQTAPMAALPWAPLPRAGEVWLVGAGPGDPGLLTLTGWQVLQAADVVVHDRLGCEEVLQHLPPHIRRVNVGKGPAGSSHMQPAINEVLATEARAGNAVVRLKGGDPFVFGRGLEEIQALRASGIATRVVPGITSAVAAPQAAGIPLTHRREARHFLVSTGHTDEGAPPRFGTADTHIFLMGLKTLEALAAGLLDAGVPADTPAALVASASTYQERRLTATLGTIAQAARAAALEPPAVLIVGAVAGFASAQAPPETILVTSSRIPPQLAQRFPQARFLWRPVTRVEGLSAEERAAARPALEASLGADWILFNSPPAVEHYFIALAAAGLDARRVRAKLAALGQEATAALEALRLVPDLAVVDGSRAGLVAQLGPQAAGTRILMPCSSSYAGGLARVLETLASVETLPVYNNRPNQPAPVDWGFVRRVFFASPGAVGRFIDAFPEAPLAVLEALAFGESATAAACRAGFAAATDLLTSPAQEDVREQMA